MIGKKSIISILSLATLASCTTPGNNNPLQTPGTQEPTSNTTAAPAITVATVTSIQATPSETVLTKELSYKSPAGPESIKISLTTKDGVITTVNTTPLATNPISLKLQAGFSENISKSVIGKAVKGLKVDTVSGASLTTGAFNEYLASVN